jgi:L-arabinose isomerase
LDNIVKRIKSASIAKYFSNMRVGTIEGSFSGMGDFYIHPRELKDRTGIDTISISAKEIAKLLPEPGDEVVKNDMELNIKEFNVGNLNDKAHIDSIRVGIAVRRWIEINGLAAFTMDFSRIDKSSGLPTLPFLEASKAMLRGIGYAGEGDLITAALTGTLLKHYPDSSFVEMFCPDWKNNRIFLSHMGEINPAVISGRARLIEKDLLFTNMYNPVITVGQFKQGEATYINLIPSKETFDLLVSQIEVIEIKNPTMMDTVNGWFKPAIPIRDFLVEFSRLGGTHHSTMVYGNVIDVVSDFGKIMGWKVYEI